MLASFANGYASEILSAKLAEKAQLSADEVAAATQLAAKKHIT